MTHFVGIQRDAISGLNELIDKLPVFLSREKDFPHYEYNGIVFISKNLFSRLSESAIPSSDFKFFWAPNAESDACELLYARLGPLGANFYRVIQITKGDLTFKFTSNLKDSVYFVHQSEIVEAH